MSIADPYPVRMSKVREEMAAAALNGAVISRPEHIYYLTGIETASSNTLLVISASDQALIGSPAEISTRNWISLIDPGSCTHRDEEKSRASLELAIGSAIESTKLTGRSIGIEETHLPYILAKAVESAARIVGDIGALIEAIRTVKDEEEVARLRFSQSLNDMAFDEAHRFIQPGISELGLFQQIYYRLSESLGSAFCWNGCLGAGLRSALENPQPSMAIIQPGDLVLVDIFSKFNHYFSDSTRTFISGIPTGQQIEIYRVLEEALGRGENHLKVGVRACDVDAAVRGVIERHGFGQYFPHHSGHGVGLWQQERPWIVSTDTSELQAGAVIALEPGIYLPGFGGMRLENVYLVTDREPINLTGYPSGIISM